MGSDQIQGGVPTSWGDPWGIAESRSAPGATALRLHGETPEVSLDRKSLQKKILMIKPSNRFWNCQIKTPTGSFNEAGVRVVGDERNGQLSKVELQRSGDDVDVFVCAGGNVRFFSICRDNQSETLEKKAKTDSRGRRSPLSKANFTSSISSLKPEILYNPSDWRPGNLEQELYSLLTN